MDCMRNSIANLKAASCITKLVAKVKALKDQILFIVFQLIFYLLDIFTDVRQAFYIGSKFKIHTYVAFVSFSIHHLSI